MRSIPARRKWPRFPLASSGGLVRVSGMTPAVSDYEKLGTFYLGREYDPETKSADGGLILYDSKDLVTHGVVLGMTGSGKTGLCLALLEEAAMDNIPAIVIDPKGDISNLLLAFPNLSATDFRPWINEDDATKKGVSPDDFAASTAELWKKGLADWGQGPERIAQLKEKVDINIFTPGSKAGIPVSILSSLAAPAFEVMDDAELLGERIESTVSSLLSLVGVDADPIQSPQAILLSNIFQHEWQGERDITLETLIRHIQKPGFDKVGVIDLESFLPQKDRQALALKFNNLLASPGFATWLEGPPLDIAKMLHAPDGKPRISIFSIAHLGDAERMFFVSLLLNQTLGWMRAQSGTTSLRALLYMDEIYGYLPPTANPPSKRPMMTLLKQGRAFGLGCLLATQNPVDLDYKALSNIGTWFLGRLQTERDKLRVLDGLEGAAGSQNAKFDRGEMEKLLSGLGNRVFLMNNVHEDHPVLFHVRWVMSYLTGPLTRTSIKALMDPKRAAFGNGKAQAKTVDMNPMAMPGVAPAESSAKPSARPLVGSGIVEKFAPPAGDAAEVTYKPHLLRVATVHFNSAKTGADGSVKVRKVNAILPEAIDWDHDLPPPLKPEELGAEPADGAGFGSLPGFAMNAANYKQVEKDFAEWLYRNQRADVFSCVPLKAYSQLGESEGEFRARLVQQAREARDAALAKIRAATNKKLDTLQGRLQTAQAGLDRQEAESKGAMMQAGASILGGLLGGLFGRKGGGGSLITKGTSAYKQHQDVNAAEEKVGTVQADIAAIEKDLQAEIETISRSYDPASLQLDTETLKPTKTNISVDSIALLWLPYDERGERAW
ncbi:ATP-binding protein [Luteolibacter sp. Populi]|uniref:ATP-binding protein n=1 Tax=Luteolibacter sp. Populi TaxID=3230487 RepID=UPI003466E53B